MGPVEVTTFSTKRILSSMARRLSLSSRRQPTRSALTVPLSHPISPRPHWPQEPLAAKPRPGFFGHLQLIRELKFARRRSTISRFWLGRASSRGAGLAIRLVRRSRRMKSGSVTVCGAPGAKGRASSAESASKTRKWLDGFSCELRPGRVTRRVQRCSSSRPARLIAATHQPR
jgi:hypothetical protein